jgi:hypothetical protein
MRFFILVLALLFCNELITANNIMGPRSFLTLRRHEIFCQITTQLIKKIIDFFYNDSSKNLRVKNDDDDNIKKKIFEKHLLPHENGTSLLKDFYPGRYSV